MNLLYSVYLTVNPAPIEGDLRPGLDENDITPGLLGFLATLFLALCVVFLIRDMVKRIRRVRYRAQAAETKLADAAAAPEAATATAAVDEPDAAASADPAGLSESGAGEPHGSREAAARRTGTDTDG